MLVNEMRKCIAQENLGPNWQARVDSMTDEQVVAIYYRLIADGANATSDIRRPNYIEV